MYIYEAFKVDDRDQLHRFMQAYPFATLITQEYGVPWATHLPILSDAGMGPYGTLIGHFARANPQRQMLAHGAEALAIFHGPQAYISPSWYELQAHDETPPGITRRRMCMGDRASSRRSGACMTCCSASSRALRASKSDPGPCSYPSKRRAHSCSGLSASRWRLHVWRERSNSVRPAPPQAEN
jgi:Putative FMN-binding domain